MLLDEPIIGRDGLCVCRNTTSRSLHGADIVVGRGSGVTQYCRVALRGTEVGRWAEGEGETEGGMRAQEGEGI